MSGRSSSRKQQPSMALDPPLKWAGGKRWLVPYLYQFWVPHARKRLVEPFCGALAVSLGLYPERALLNDLNPHLIRFYEQVQRNGLPMTLEMENDVHYYDAHRQWFNRIIALPVARESERAAAELFYYLNRTCFNGLCRFNSAGAFNVPFGRYKTIAYRTDFLDYQRRFERWKFSSVDFQEVRLLPGDFIYADPPYDAGFTAFTAEGFEWEDQVRLAEWLSAHPGPVVASNLATDRILDLYQQLGFELAVVDAPRRISRDGNRAAVQEMLASRNI